MTLRVRTPGHLAAELSTPVRLRRDQAAAGGQGGEVSSSQRAGRGASMLQEIEEISMYTIIYEHQK